MVTNSTKVCRGCQLDKPLTDFHRDATISSGYKARCRVCVSGPRKKRHNPRRDRELKLIRRYGITIAEYNEMYVQQLGRCKICLKNAKLVVDHCHQTGRVRGLLCDQCNTALGLFKDSKQSLESAISYLDT